MKREKSVIPAAAAILLLLAAVFPASAQEGGGASAPQVPALRLPEWLDERFAADLGRALGSLIAESPIPARSLDMVLGQLGSGWLPADPAEAALMIYAAAYETDRAQRRGVAAQEVKSRIRQELQVLKEQVHEFSIGRQLRRSGELDEFMRENRRAFMDGRDWGSGWNDLGHGGGR